MTKASEVGGWDTTQKWLYDTCIITFYGYLTLQSISIMHLLFQSLAEAERLATAPHHGAWPFSKPQGRLLTLPSWQKHYRYVIHFWLLSATHNINFQAKGFILEYNTCVGFHQVQVQVQDFY